MPQSTETSVIALTADHPLVIAQLQYEIDYYGAAKSAICKVLGMIPFVGEGVSFLVEIFWPVEGQDVWADIRDRVEALIDQKISERVWGQTADALSGLRNVIEDYLDAAKHYKEDPGMIAQRWNIAHGHFRHDLPAFQSDDYKVLLLPLFAQFANLHLMLLRDGAKFGAEWGWSQAVVDDIRRTLNETIAGYSAYTTKVYDDGLAAIKAKTPGNPHHTEPYLTVNRFQREMTLSVLDFQITWPYYDPVKYDKPVEIVVSREIYTDCAGTADDHGITLPGAPSQPISKITVWGWDRVDAAQVEYPEGGGPAGQTSTGRMGNKYGGSSGPLWGGIFDLAHTGPVVRVLGRCDHILDEMQFGFEDGSVSNKLGGRFPHGWAFDWQYPGEVMSSIKIMGESKFYHSADCAVFGFKFKNERFPQPKGDTLRLMYMADPTDADPAAFAQRLQLDETAASDLARTVRDNGWDILREISGAARKRRLAARSEVSTPR